MFHTILVPLDGSALSERALPYATTLARVARARMVLLRAIVASPLPDTDPTDAEVSRRRQAQAYLDDVAEPLRREGLAVEPHVYYGDAAEAILDAARVQHAELVVMSTHGRSGLGRWAFGSVADEVLRSGAVPVLLVPPACQRAWTADQPARLLVPLDGSELAEAALPAARALARDLDAELVLVQVVELPVPLAPDGVAYLAAFDLDTAEATARAYLEEVAAEIRASGQRVTTEVAVSGPDVAGQVATTIATVARQWGATLTVLATHGRGGLARVVLGSAATGLIQRTDAPLLLVRPAKQPRPVEAPVAVVGVGEAATPVALTAPERELVRRGLAGLLHGTPDRSDARGRPAVGGTEAAATQALLARLEALDGTVAGTPVRALVGAEQR
jgi:nucleotide-binding universal stress UspA family protein